MWEQNDAWQHPLYVHCWRVNIYTHKCCIIYQLGELDWVHVLSMSLRVVDCSCMNQIRSVAMPTIENGNDVILWHFL